MKKKQFKKDLQEALEEAEEMRKHPEKYFHCQSGQDFQLWSPEDLEK